MNDATRSPSILVVEDESLVRMTIVETFEEAGFQVLEASSGEKALKLIAETGKLSALFTDVELESEMDGFYLARMIHDKHPDMQIVVVSGRQNPKSGELPEGAIFIGKPYDPDLIATTLNNMISRQQK